MELLIVLAALIASGVLAMRFGQDTTDRIVSEEEFLSRHGFTLGSSEASRATSSVPSLAARAARPILSSTSAIGARVHSLGRDISRGVDASDMVWPTLHEYPYRTSRH